MFAVENEAAEPPLPYLDDTAMHELGVKLEAKYRLMSDGWSPKISQCKDDNESVRRKLWDSLTSALEMVVSKQLVKSVLGVVKDSEAPEVGNLRRHVQLQAQDVLLVDQIIASGAQMAQEASEGNRTHGMGLDIKDKFQYESKAKKDGTRICFPSLPSAGKSEHSLVRKFCSETEEGFLAPHEATCGLELMEQARRVARDVEFCLFSLNSGVNKKYREKARSLLFNLKDKSNPELRARVFGGEIKPKILVRMSAEQLASKELSRWRTAKAEEFASMVVLSDADLDPRQIVKKTHKGEFQLVAEGVGISATTSGASPGAVIPLNVEEDARGSKRGYSSSGRVGILDTKWKVCNDSCLEVNTSLGQVKMLSSFQVTAEKEKFEKEGTKNNVNKDLCTTDALNGTVSDRAQKSFDANAASEDRTLDAFNLTPTGLNSKGEMLEKLLVSYPDSCTRKLSKISTTRCTESGGLRSHLCEISDRVCGAAVWEGSIQLSATRFALINGFYESGEKLELKDWPRSVEVKGRVRLVVLDKFLQDLQLSRSRTVTILSLCPSECQGDAKQSTAYLKQMADHYRKGGRAGFVEPRPGFELYLVDPSSMPLELSSPEDLGSIKATSKREDRVFFGLVVWRKSQPQGPPFSRGPNQNSSVQKVAISNEVHESLTKVDIMPPNCRETPSLVGWLPASRKTPSAPSLVYGSGNSSMHNTKPCREGTTEHNPPSSRDWCPPFPMEIDHRAPILVPASDKVTETAIGAVTKSVSRSQNLIDDEDCPPGFLARPVQSSQVRCKALIADSQNVVKDCQAALADSLSVPDETSLVPLQSTEIFKDAPPGFLQQSSVNFANGMHTTIFDEDEDLPEFNFDLERMVSSINGTSNSLLPPNPAHFAALHPHNIASQSFARLHLVSDVPNTCHGYRHNLCDLRPPRLEDHTVPGGRPLRYNTQYEESFAQAMTVVPTVEGWCGPERKAETTNKIARDFSMGVLPSSGKHKTNPQLRSPTKTSFTGEEFVSMTPMSGIDQRISQQMGPLEHTAAGKEKPCIFGYESKRALERPVPVPLRIPSTWLQFPRQTLGKPADQFFPRIDTPRQQAAALPSNEMLPSMPLVSAANPVQSRHQVSLVHMVVQHQRSMMKSTAVTWRPRGGPFLNQDPWRDHQQFGSVQLHCRSENFHRKPLQLEPGVPDDDTSSKVARTGKEGISIPEHYQKCGRSSSVRRYQSIRGDIELAPVGSKDMLGDEEALMTLREPKSLKRGRDRERDQ